MSFFGAFTDDCLSIRRQSPLILNITNYVAMSLSANSLLAIGASPLMSAEPLEISELATRCAALAVNIGCLEERSIVAMRKAAAAARAAGRPWVLDPAGAGASTLRTDIALELLRLHPAVLRANAGEVISLAEAAFPGTAFRATQDNLRPDSPTPLTEASRGVDSIASSEDALDSAKALAREFGTVVSVSGAIDYITDGEKVIGLKGGSPLMPRVSAMGCTASALTGAFIAVDGDPLQAAAGAMALMKAAGSAAAAALGPGESVGTLPARFLDYLATFDPSTAMADKNALQYFEAGDRKSIKSLNDNALR